MEGTKALLHGVYKVNRIDKVYELPHVLIPISDAEDWGAGPYYHYDLIRNNKLADLEGRLVIDWGRAVTSWHQ